MKNFALMSAIALTGAVGFTACSSSNDVAEDINPNYNPETNAVKTEFVINVTQPGERTRMTAANAGAETFQGINNMKLFCMTGVPGSTDNSITDAKKLTLTSYDNTPTLSGDNTTGSSKVYTLYIPTGTSNFLFYATTWASVGANNKFDYGSLVNNLGAASTVVTATPATTDIKFNLEPIVSTATDVTTPQGTLLTVLNGIAGAYYDKDNSSSVTEGDITWASTASKTETHWQALRTAFNQFTNQASGGDVRQGSSAAILSMVVDLFGAVNAVYTSEQDADAKGVAKAILDKIMDYFTVTLSETTYTWPSHDYKSNYDVNFPESVKLPTGAAVLKYETGAFQYVNDGHMGTATVSTAYNKFTYPSELTYYCNSGLRQSTTSQAPTAYPTTSAAWITNESWSAQWTDGGAVSPSTRAVAMKDNITYGAAQLVSNVKLGDNVATNEANALVDNRDALSDNPAETDQKFYDVTNPIVLKVHGLLIAGQPVVARYDYLPLGTKTTSSTTFDYVVYDLFSSEGRAVATTAWTTPNYTLVLDNYKAGDGDNPAQNTVNVALEMTADKDFYGASGKIKAGQKFYLIGSLDPASPATGSSITWADHKSFKDGDTGKGVNRVFIRDAKTTATFTLGANCLKSAYSTIPDLRSTQMVFGISVDLAWKAGLTFDVNIGQ